MELIKEHFIPCFLQLHKFVPLWFFDEENGLWKEEGKAILTRKLRHLKITLNDTVINEMAAYFSLKTSFDLFYRVGNGAIENTQLKAEQSNKFFHLA